MRWIRWKGLIPFVLITSLVAALWALVVDGYVEGLIEDAGTALVGAKVELDGADVTLFPAGLTLVRLQVTDPDEPMINAVDIARIAFSLDTGRLLMRKVIVDEMTVEGVRFGTERKTSGAVAKKPPPPGEVEEKKEPAFQLPALTLPDVRDVVKTEELETLRLADDLEARIKREEDAWKKRLDALPGEDTLKEYERRIKSIEDAAKGGPAAVIGAAAGVKKLKGEMEADLKRIRDARNEFRQSVRSLENQVQEIAHAPERDIRRLKEQYGLTPEGLGNATALLVGDQARHWVEEALRWYARLAPVVESAQARASEPAEEKPLRAKGVDVRFPEKEPLPDFLVRTARASAEMAGGTVDGTIRNITGDQNITGRPVRFDFSGRALGKLAAVSLGGVADRTKPDAPRDTADLLLEGYRVEEIPLSKSTDLPVTLASASAGMALRAERSGKLIRADVNGSLGDTAFRVGAPDNPDRLTAIVRSVLEGVRHVGFSADVTGTLDDYDIAISSDLDQVLTDSLSRALREEVKHWEGELRAAVKEQTQGALAQVRDELGSLGPLGSQLAGREDQLGGLLKGLAKKQTRGFKLPF